MIGYDRLSKLKKFLLIASLGLLCAAIGTGLWLYNTYSINKKYHNIYTYDADIDKPFILQLFKDNWYWLVSEHSLDFSPEYMLDNKASSKKPQHKGNLTIKTYRKDNKPLGFVAYYTKELLEGFILFVAVDEKERGHGYARELLQYAIDDLARRGCITISLITRTVNERGRKLYEGMGFKQIWTDGAFIKYQKKIE